MKLTDMIVKNASLPEGVVQEEIPDAGCRGLMLILGKTAKAWQVRFRLLGKRQWMPLGRYPAVSLVEARALASGALLKVDRGIDPGVADVGTVSAAWDGFWSLKAATLKHPAHDESAWRNHLQPHIGDLALDALSPAAFDRLLTA